MGFFNNNKFRFGDRVIFKNSDIEGVVRGTMDTQCLVSYRTNNGIETIDSVNMRELKRNRNIVD